MTMAVAARIQEGSSAEAPGKFQPVSAAAGRFRLTSGAAGRSAMIGNC